jgi:ribosomal protein S18 acetylase RimI-like enzyme
MCTKSSNGAGESELIVTLGFNENERDTLADICWHGFHSKFDWIYKSNVKLEKEAMRALLLSETTFVARLNGKVVGFLSFETLQTNRVNKELNEVMNRHQNWRCIFFMALEYKPKKDEFYIAMVAVSPEARGLGVGTKLLQKAYETARDMKLKHVTLYVIEENEAAKRLYNREGFVDEEYVRMRCCLPRIFSFKAAWFQKKPLNLPDNVNDDSKGQLCK